jgi:hypothetical protein
VDSTPNSDNTTSITIFSISLLANNPTILRHMNGATEKVVQINHIY